MMASDRNRSGPQINLGASIRDLRHEVRLGLGAVDKLTGRLERIDRELAELEKYYFRRRGRIRNFKPVRVVHNLEIHPCADGSGSIKVAIAGGRRFLLPPRLAGVFRFIASGEKGQDGADPLVGCRSKDEIIKFLRGDSDKDFRARYVISMVNLLRDALREAGYDRRLIQTGGQKGYRLALKPGARGLLPDSAPEW